jgi:hypothetical protein
LPSGNSVNSNSPNQFGHHFDLSKSLAPEIISAYSVTKWSSNSNNQETTKGSFKALLLVKGCCFLITSITRCALRNGFPIRRHQTSLIETQLLCPECVCSPSCNLIIWISILVYQPKSAAVIHLFTKSLTPFSVCRCFSFYAIAHT